MSENTVWSSLRLMPDSLVIENRQKGRNKKKSEWKTLIVILHSIKSLCSEIDVEGDYDIAGEYFKSLDYSFDIRELTEDENARLDYFRMSIKNMKPSCLRYSRRIQKGIILWNFVYLSMMSHLTGKGARCITAL